jgi:hypothetical protein
VIKETACRADHLDADPELIDGRQSQRRPRLRDRSVTRRQLLDFIEHTF